MSNDLPMFSVRIDRTQYEQRVVVRGELDLATSPQLRSRLDHVISSTVGDLSIDVASVRYIDSSGLATLLWAHDRLALMGRHLNLLNPSAQVVRLLEICGVSDLFAVDCVNGGRNAPPGVVEVLNGRRDTAFDALAPVRSSTESSPPNSFGS